MSLQNFNPNRLFQTTALVLVACVGLIVADRCEAQYSTIGTPFNNVSDNWYERQGVNFGFQLGGTRGVNPNSDRARGVFGLSPTGGFTPNINFSQGSARSAVPPFGGYDPGAEAHLGFAVRNGNGSGFNLGLFGGKGNTRTFTNTTPRITVPNGVPGQIFDGRMTPFVTGITPIVGSGLPFSPATDIGGAAAGIRQVSPIEIALRRMQEEMGMTPNQENWGEIYQRYQEEKFAESPAPKASPVYQESTASSADLSVAEIKRRRQAKQEAEAAKLDLEIENMVAKVKSAIAEEKYGVARVTLSQAMRKATGQRRKELEAWYQEIGGLKSK